LKIGAIAFDKSRYPDHDRPDHGFLTLSPELARPQKAANETANLDTFAPLPRQRFTWPLSIKAECIDNKDISKGIKVRKREKNCKDLKEDTRRIAGVRP
jgi:hypothetical protein